MGNLFNVRQCRRWLSGICVISLVMALGACASYSGITTSVAVTDHLDMASTENIAQSRDAWPHDNWWLDYGDPQLNRLIQHALENSPTLVAAQVRMARAQALSDVARSATGVQVTGAGDIQYGRLSENYILPKPPLGEGGQVVGQGLATANINYNLDLWGKEAAIIHAADAQITAAAFDRDAARLALTTAIVDTYSQLAAQYELQVVLLATQKQRQAIRLLTDQRVVIGLDTRVEAKQAESNEFALGADIENLATSIDLMRLRLAALDAVLV